MANVDMRELEHITQKGAVSLRIRAVNDRMRASNHGDAHSIVDSSTNPSTKFRSDAPEFDTLVGEKSDRRGICARILVPV